MKVITKTVLITDRKKEPIQPGKEVELPDKEAKRLLAKGLVELPVVEENETEKGSDNEK